MAVLSVRSATTIALSCFLLASALVSAQNGQGEGARELNLAKKLVNFLWQPHLSSYKHVWPDMRLDWKIIVGSIIGFFGAACGSTGGVGGGGIFVPMLTLIIGFDTKSSTALSKCTGKEKVSVLQNVYWKELGLLVFVWVAFLALQISKIPVSVGVSLYEAISLYKGRRLIASKGGEGANWKVHQLVLYCCCGILAGVVGGLLGLGGGFILGPLFLELGIPPQVSSATATFAMTFSSSMSVVEYYLLRRFHVPYALYFATVATIAAFVGQHMVRKIIVILGRASLIVFILAFTIFVSAISLGIASSTDGGVGTSNMIKKIHRKEYMGFENLCTNNA